MLTSVAWIPKDKVVVPEASAAQLPSFPPWLRPETPTPSPSLLEVAKQPWPPLLPWRSVTASQLWRALVVFISILEASQALRKKKKPLRRDASWQIKESMRSSSRFFIVFSLTPYCRKWDYIQTRTWTALLYFWENKRNLAMSWEASDIHIFFWLRRFCQMSKLLAERGCFYFNLQISLLWIMTLPWFGY